MAAGGCVALYCRISKAPNGQVESVERQERWGRDYAARVRPDLPVRVFSDNDLSAFEDGVHRPGYEALRAAIRAGEVALLWTVEQTRLEANRGRWVALVAELDDAGLTEIHTDRDGTVRLDEVADIKHVLAWHERKRLRERVRDTLADKAAQGRPGPGTSFAYRHQRDPTGRSQLVVVPDEAAAARWAAEALLTGWTLTGIARELTARGVPTRRARGAWSARQVRSMLQAPTLAGKRVHRGVVVGDGDWEPVLDEVTWRRVCALLDGRNRDRRRPVRYLLAGLAMCGRCGAPLVGERSERRRDTYCCKRRLDVAPTGCGRLRVAAGALDAHVVGLLLHHLDTPDFRARLAEGDPYQDTRNQLAAALADVDERRRRAGRLWAAGDLDEAEWDGIRAELRATHERLSGELVQLPAPATVVDPDEVAVGWEAMTVDERRHVLRLFLGRVVVHPTSKRGPVWDPTRVQAWDTHGERVEIDQRPAD